MGLRLLGALFRRPPAPFASQRPRGFFSCSCKLQPWRPSLDDVQRLSEGRPAKTRGAGSRQVPHRLNTDEAKLFKLAKDKGFLTLKGTGYRRERKGSPLANIFRQWCDAKGTPCILVEQDPSGQQDTVLVDLSPLRSAQLEQVVAACRVVAAEHGCSPAGAGLLRSPFTTLVPQALAAFSGEAGAAGELLELEQQQQAQDGLPHAAAPGESEIGSSGGSGGGTARTQDNACSEEEQDAKGAAEPLDANAVAPADAGAQLKGLEGSLMLSAPIWRQPPKLLAFLADRGNAKTLAKALAAALLTY